MRYPLFLVVIIMLFCFETIPAWADLGPKPTIVITMPAELADQVISGTLLLCQKPDCSDAKPLQAFGPQGFYCRTLSSNHIDSSPRYVAPRPLVDLCSGMAYGFAPFLQLQLNLKEGRDLTSSVFTKKSFNAQFNAALTQNQLTVTEQ